MFRKAKGTKLLEAASTGDMVVLRVELAKGKDLEARNDVRVRRSAQPPSSPRRAGGLDAALLRSVLWAHGGGEGAAEPRGGRKCKGPGV